MSQLPTPPDCPAALQPDYPVPVVNEPVPLYMALMLEQGSNRVCADGSVLLQWFPSPRISFTLNDADPRMYFNESDRRILHLGDGRFFPDVHINLLRASGAGPFSTAGEIQGPLPQSSGPAFGYLRFLIPNFPDVFGTPIQYPSGSSCAGRFQLRACNWLVTIDQIDHSQEAFREACSQVGFFITHVGQLEKEDHSPFTEEEALNCLQGLGWFLSFAAGRWTAPVLACGNGPDGSLVKELWNVPRLAPWRNVMSWMDDRYADHLTELWPGFMRRWADPDWNEVLELAIHWYVEANAQAGSVDGSIILIQAAFEMMASAVVVVQNQWVSTGAFENGLPAADRIRLLFVWAGIPFEIPPSLTDLKTLARGRNWGDVSQALTEIRNPLTHPTPKNRDRFRNYPMGARVDAWTLGLWLLELCLLRLCDYNGTYGCRLAPRYAGEVQPVPWSR
jgi:hypothetical protein